MRKQKYRYAKAVVAAAECDAEKFGDLPAMMDDTKNVHGTHRELQRRKTGNGRNPALRKMAHLQPNREVERAIPARDGISKTRGTPLEHRTRMSDNVPLSIAAADAR